MLLAKKDGYKSHTLFSTTSSTIFDKKAMRIVWTISVVHDRYYVLPYFLISSAGHYHYSVYERDDACGSPLLLSAFTHGLLQ